MSANYRLGSSPIEAKKHTGTDESADAIAAWVRSHKAEIGVLHKGEYDYDLHSAYLLLGVKRHDRLVQPNFWVVRVDGSNEFYSVYPEIFANLYKPYKGVSDDKVATAPD